MSSSFYNLYNSFVSADEQPVEEVKVIKEAVSDEWTDIASVLKEYNIPTVNYTGNTTGVSYISANATTTFITFSGSGSYTA